MPKSHGHLGSRRSPGPQMELSQSSGLALAAIGAVLAIVLTVPISSAASPDWRNTAPFHKAAVHLGFDFYNHRGCAQLVKLVPGSWNRSTGAGGWSFNESVPNCKPGYSPDGYGYLRFVSNVTTPLSIPTASSGSAAIVVRWAASNYGTVAMTNGTCPAVVMNATGYGSVHCLIETRERVTQVVFVLDQTDGSIIYANSSPRDGPQVAFSIISNATTCKAFQCSTQYFQNHLKRTSFSWAHTMTWRFNASLNLSHVYAVRSILAVETLAQVLGAIGAAASVSETYHDQLMFIRAT